MGIRDAIRNYWQGPGRNFNEEYNEDRRRAEELERELSRISPASVRRMRDYLRGAITEDDFISAQDQDELEVYRAWQRTGKGRR